MVENEQDSVCHSYSNNEGEKKNQSIKNWCQIITEELNENKKIFVWFTPNSLYTSCSKSKQSQKVR